MTLVELALARIAEMEKRAEGANCGGSATSLILTDLPDLCALVKAFLSNIPEEDLYQGELAALKAFTEAK